MAKVSVTISKRQLAKTVNIPLQQVYIIKQLKARGIPVVGVIALEGVSCGKLTLWTDDLLEEYVYEWEGEPEELPDPFAMS